MYSSLINIIIISGLYRLRSSLVCAKSLAPPTAFQTSSTRTPLHHLQGALAAAATSSRDSDSWRLTPSSTELQNKINQISRLAKKTSLNSEAMVNIPAVVRVQSRPMARRKRSPNQTRLCGDFLIQMLNVVCLSGRRKREIDESERHFYYTDRKELAAYNDGVRPTRLSDICCRQACSIVTLQNACHHFY
jgi:hypothetical protein